MKISDGMDRIYRIRSVYPVHPVNPVKINKINLLVLSLKCVHTFPYVKKRKMKEKSVSPSVDFCLTVS